MPQKWNKWSVTCCCFKSQGKSHWYPRDDWLGSRANPDEMMKRKIPVNFKFPQQWIWRLPTARMKQWVVWWQITNSLEELAESTYILKKEVAGSSKEWISTRLYGVASHKILISGGRNKKSPCLCQQSNLIYSAHSQSHNWSILNIAEMDTVSSI